MCRDAVVYLRLIVNYLKLDETFSYFIHSLVFPRFEDDKLLIYTKTYFFISHTYANILIAQVVDLFEHLSSFSSQNTVNVHTEHTIVEDQGRFHL